MARHERKSGGQVGDSGRGSSAFTGAVEIILSIRRPEGNARPAIREIHALSRFDQTPDVLVVELGEDGYKALGDSAAVAKAEAREAILKAAPTSEAVAVSLDELLKVTDLGRTTVQKAVDTLLAAGELRRIGEGKKGNPYRYWHPTGPEEPPEKPTPEDGRMRSAATHTLEGAERKADPSSAISGSKPDALPTASPSDPQEGCASARSQHRDRRVEMVEEDDFDPAEDDHLSPGYYAVTKTVTVGDKEIRVYGAEDASKPPETKLAELGWVRNEKATGGRKPSLAGSSGGKGLALARDPVAHSISIALGLRFDGVAAVTAGDVWYWEGQRSTPTELISQGWPKDSRAMHKHLRRLAPVLRTTKHTYRFRDDEGERRGDPFAVKTREGHMDVQYWQKTDGEMEGVWVFAADLAAPDDPERVAQCVWERVKRLEGVVEDASDWPDG